MNRNLIINSIKDQERTDAQQKRGGANHHVTAMICQCGDPDCGAFHTIYAARPLPSTEEADEMLRAHKRKKR